MFCTFVYVLEIDICVIFFVGRVVLNFLSKMYACRLSQHMRGMVWASSLILVLTHFKLSMHFPFEFLNWKRNGFEFTFKFLLSLIAVRLYFKIS